MTNEGVTESRISHLLSCLYGYDDSGGRVSLAWFRRNEFRLHSSHDCVAGPDGDKWSKTTQETLGGSGVSEANGVLRNPYHPHALTKYIEKTD